MTTDTVDPEAMISVLMINLGIGKQRAMQIMKTSLLRKGLPTGRGWLGESRILAVLSSLGLTTDDFWQQFALGPYRLDFAFPYLRLAIEVDGWVHTTASIKQKDRRRDKVLHDWGWMVLRVEADAAFEELRERLRMVLSRLGRISA